MEKVLHKQLSSLFLLPPAGLNTLNFLVKPSNICITWVRLNKWRCNHMRQKWRTMLKWTDYRPHWHSLAVGRAQPLSDEKRNRLPLACFHQCLETRTKFQKSFLFAITIFFAWVGPFVITFPGILSVGISHGLCVGGDMDSLSHLPGVTCCNFAAEPHWGSGREWLGLYATYSLSTNPMLTTTVELPPVLFGRPGSPFSWKVLRRQL